MSIRDAARASGLSPKALRRRIERGTLGSVLVGGRRRIPVDDLVRRGLVPDGADPAAPEAISLIPEQAELARRVRALESRVAALEIALDRAVSPVATSEPSLAPTRLVVGDPRSAIAPESTPTTTSSSR